MTQKITFDAEWQTEFIFRYFCNEFEYFPFKNTLFFFPPSCLNASFSTFLMHFEVVASLLFTPR